MIKMYNIAIIILNYIDYDMTIGCVNKLLDLKNQYLICIVDNNSSNNSFKVLKDTFSEKDNIEVIMSGKNGGFSYGNNFGINYINEKYKDIKYIAIMNPDIIVEYDIFSSLTEKLDKHDEIAQITGMQIYNDQIHIKKCGWKLPSLKDLFIRNSSLLKRFFKVNDINALKIYDKDTSLSIVDVISGCFFIIKNDIFKEIKYFDENVFLYYEENIISTKLKRLGYKVAISIEDHFIHAHKNKDRKMLKIKNAQNDFRIILKSQIYYVKNYVKYGRNFSWLLQISGRFHINVEIPLNTTIKKLKS